MANNYDPKIPHEYDVYFQRAADAHNVPYELLRKIGWIESRFNPKAVSPTKPRGVMQFTKATGNAYGLVSDDDFFNPEKSIMAGANYLSDLIKQFDGDELKAALAYNQGAGKLGRPQLKAYDDGDYSKISKEGYQYINHFIDVAQSPKRGEIEAFNLLRGDSKGITTKPQKIPLEELTAGTTKAPQVTGDLPESHSLFIEGVDTPAPREPFSKEYWRKKGVTIEDDENRSTWSKTGASIYANLHNSMLGVAIRAARTGDWDVFKSTITPTRWNSHIFSEAELEELRTIKNPAYINVATSGNAESLPALIKMANDNYEADLAAADAGLGAKLLGGVVGAGVDPLTYVPIVGVAGKGGKLINKMFVVGAQAGAMNAVSEGVRTSMAGGEAHYAEAILSGALLGGGLVALSEGISKAYRSKGKDLENPFLPSQVRLEARETARNTGGVDLSKLPPDDSRVFESHKGVEYSKLENEPGAVVLKDGSIISDTNIINPQTAKEYESLNIDDRAAKGIKLGGFTELGLKILDSDNPEIRGLGQDLLRSPTGMQSGSNGKFGATSEDIDLLLKNRNQKAYYDLDVAMKEALKDPQYSVGIFRRTPKGARQDVYKKVSLAIEHPELYANKLNKSELKVRDILKEHFDVKRELMENPSVFGNEARSVFPGSNHKGTYIPHIYSRVAKILYTQMLGSAEKLQKAISKSWMASYHSRPHVKERVDEYLSFELGIEKKDIKEADVLKYANDKAYGVAQTDNFINTGILEENIKGIEGLENNKFLESRNLFDSDISIPLGNGKEFSVNDLRDFNLDSILPSYDRRVDGDISIMGGTGKTTKEIKQQVMALEEKAGKDGRKKADVDALKEVLKILTGRARRNQDSIGETLLRATTDLSYFAKNAYMGLQNLTEISGMLAKGNIRAMLQGVPGFRNLAFRNRVVSGDTLKDLHSIMFGREFDQTIRPTREDIIQRLRENTEASPLTTNVVGSIKYTTQELAARSPFTKFLNGSSNYLLDMGRQGFLSDIIEHSITGKGAGKWINDDMLNSFSISKEQWKGIQDVIREHVVRDNNTGKYTIKNKDKLIYDPRTMDLWRMADKVASETMLRPHKISHQDSKAYGAGVKMAMQFKNFTIKSLNAKFIRSGHEMVKNHRYVDTALTYAFELGITGYYFVVQAHIKAASLQKEQQKEYLEKALDPKMIAYAAVSRGARIGAPLSIANIGMGLLGYDQGKMVRSSILPKEVKKRDKNSVTSRETTSDILNNLGEQVPALNYLASTLAAGKNAYSYATARNGSDELEALSGLMNATREMVPNDPITQQTLIKIFEANGVYLKDKKKNSNRR